MLSFPLVEGPGLTGPIVFMGFVLAGRPRPFSDGL
jgi:hypothetical protein